MKKLQNIMLIDDDEIYQFLCDKIFKDSGVIENVISCTGAEEALKYLSENKTGVPELIFLDINMPGMNGWDFLEEFKKIDKNIRKDIIIAMHSSSVLHEDRIKAGQYQEVSDFIDKPLTVESIRDLVEKHFIDNYNRDL